MSNQIVLDETGKGGDRNPKPDGAGREINRDHILRSAGITLRPAEAPEGLKLLASLLPEQIMNGMEQRARMGLHCNLVLWAECGEIERGHDRRHRRAACLVAADLQVITAFAKMIGVVDHPRR